MTPQILYWSVLFPLQVIMLGIQLYYCLKAWDCLKTPNFNSSTTDIEAQITDIELQIQETKS